MSSTARLTVLMEFWFSRFHRFGQLGLPVADNGRIPIVIRESNKVSQNTSLICWRRNINELISLVNRYGIRVDPVQWIIVLTGRDEGSGWPSGILLICKWYLSSVSILWNDFIETLFCVYRFIGAHCHLSADRTWSLSSTWIDRQYPANNQIKNTIFLNSILEYNSWGRWNAGACHQYHCTGTDTDGHYSRERSLVQFE